MLYFCLITFSCDILMTNYRKNEINFLSVCKSIVLSLEVWWTLCHLHIYLITLLSSLQIFCIVWKKRNIYIKFVWNCNETNLTNVSTIGIITQLLLITVLRILCSILNDIEFLFQLCMICIGFVVERFKCILQLYARTVL